MTPEFIQSETHASVMRELCMHHFDHTWIRSGFYPQCPPIPNCVGLLGSLIVCFLEFYVLTSHIRMDTCVTVGTLGDFIVLSPLEY